MIQRRAATFTDSQGTMDSAVQKWLDDGWKIEQMVGGATHYSLRALIIFTKAEESTEE